MSSALRTFAIATSVLLACATWASAGPYYDVVTQDAPIGYWRLGEAPGSPVYPAEGGAQDATVNDRDLTYVNFNSASDLGKPGAIVGDTNTAAQFNAAAGAYLERRLGASTSDFAFASGQGFAIEFWIKTTQTTAGAPVVGKGYDTTDASPWYLMRINDPAGKVDLYLRPGEKRAISTTNVTDGQWHHVVGVYDTRGGASTADGVVKIYVDGTLEASTGSVVDAAYGTNSRNLVFGRHSTTRYFDGQADELAIYGQALDSGQVWLHNRVGRSGQVPYYTSAVLSNPTLRGYFPLGESANGVEAADASGRRNHMPYNPPERPTGGSPGIPGMLGDTAYAFDGVNDVLFNANYASTGYDPDFSFASGQSFSLELWVNTTQAPAPGTNVGLVTKGYDSATAYLPWYLMRMDAAGRPDIYVRNALSQNGNAIATTAINDGQWHHLVGVYDASANQVRMFVDGRLEASASAPLGDYGTNAAPLLFGRHGGRVFQGLIDEAAVYASALGDLTVLDHYNAGTGVVQLKVDFGSSSAAGPRQTGFHEFEAAENATFGNPPIVRSFDLLGADGQAKVKINGYTHFRDYAAIAGGPFVAQSALLSDMVLRNANGTMKLTLDDLAPGTYEITTYHHSTQFGGGTLDIRLTDAAGYNQVVANGVPVTSGTTPSGISAQTFQFVVRGSSVIIDFLGGSTTLHSPLNGFELRLVEPGKAVVKSQVLALDFNARSAAGPGNTQAGFQEFVLPGASGGTRSFGAIDVTLTPTGASTLDDRRRTEPTNSGAFTQQELLRDVVFASGAGTADGLDVLIRGLAPLREYEVTLWSFDDENAGSRISDWSVNGSLAVNDYVFDGNSASATLAPASNDVFSFSFLATANAAGEILIGGRATGVGNPGVFLNALVLTRVEIVPEPSTLALASLGVVGLIVVGWRRRR